ncbi:hypothetical protein [Shewanella pneumatophori]|nr:hypothetical protein [Shewanella pneumatophori]
MDNNQEHIINQDENNDASVISILQQISATLERIEANTNHNKND